MVRTCRMVLLSFSPSTSKTISTGNAGSPGSGPICPSVISCIPSTSTSSDWISKAPSPPPIRIETVPLPRIPDELTMRRRGSIRSPSIALDGSTGSMKMSARTTKLSSLFPKRSSSPIAWARILQVVLRGGAVNVTVAVPSSEVIRVPSQKAVNASSGMVGRCSPQDPPDLSLPARPPRERVEPLPNRVPYSPPPPPRSWIESLESSASP